MKINWSNNFTQVFLFFLFFISLVLGSFFAQSNEGDADRLIYSKDIEIDLSACDSPKYLANPGARNYCLQSFDLERCRQETTEFSKNFCFLEAARSRKDKLICHNMSSLNDRYLCCGVVAERTQDSQICFEIPMEMTHAKVSGGEIDLKLKCYEGIHALNPKKSAPHVYKSLMRLNSEASFIEKICTYGYDKNDDLQDLKNNLQLNQCGDQYKVSYIFGEDLPFTILDSGGQKVVDCGGMPRVNSSNDWDERCDVACDSHDVCGEVVLDCSQFQIRKTIPTDFSEQMEYYRKKILYAFKRQTPEDIIRECQDINDSRSRVD